MSTATTKIDFDRLFRLRLVVARYGEMDAVRWGNTRDAARRTALQGRSGSILMSRGFPRTHRFAQARLVFEVSRALCAEVFNPPGCVTLWSLPAAIGNQFDARWARWLEDREAWQEFFLALEPPPAKAALRDLLSAAAPMANKGRKPKGRSAQLRTSASKPLPAAAPATTPDTVLDEATLPAVKDAVASVADGASKTDVLAATGISDRDWNRAISALFYRGDVTPIGQSPGTLYHSSRMGKE